MAHLRETPGFLEFYEAYPKHQSPDAAARVFRKLTLEDGVDPKRLIQAAREYALNVNPKDLRYVPLPAGWLTDGKYDDSDLFTDQHTAVRNFFTRAWRDADVKSIYDEYGEIYPKPAPPDGMTDEELRKWDIDKKREWVAGVARKRLGDSTGT